MAKIIMEKRGQVTLFIILGIVIVMGIGIMMMVLLKSDTVETKGLDPSANPRGFIDKCLQEAMEEPIEQILAGGGEMNPDFTVTYNNTDYSYLCYQGDNYAPCYNLASGLEQKVENEIESYLEIIGVSGFNKIEECFAGMKDDLESKGYKIVQGQSNYFIDILPGEIRLDLEKSVSISKGDSTQKFTNFDTKVPSQIYDLIRVTNEITNGESTNCEFEYVGYMLINPEYRIRAPIRSGNRLYSISMVGKHEEIKFAVRGCILPSGLF
jgi:hypothetical protein